MESKASAGRPACCSLPAEYQQSAHHHHHHHHPHRDDDDDGAAIVTADGGETAASDINPPAAGEFVDLNATRCSSALLLHNRPGSAGGGPPICDSRQYPLQLANRTLVLLPAGRQARPESHWFWDLFPPALDTAAASAASQRPPAISLRFLLLLTTSLLLVGRRQHCCWWCSSFVS